MPIDFQTSPERYRHWRLTFDGPVATLAMDVDETAGLFPGYELKLNSYDLGVDIELYDATQRLRFEHPEVKVVLLRSAKERVFCAGANIRMLSKATHAHKVNFCKFTNETRNSIEAAGAESGQAYVCAVNGTAAGGGYELALAADHIVLVDDGTASVSLPEVPLLAVLPGTGGLTRVVDKRKVRRDLADVFCTLEEGMRGAKAVKWRLVDETVPNTKLEARLAEIADDFAARSDRPDSGPGVALTPLAREAGEGFVRYPHLTIDLDRAGRTATITLQAPEDTAPADAVAATAQGAAFWPLALARALDDAILHLRANEPELGVLIVKSQGALDRVLAHDEFLRVHAGHWFIREVIGYWKRTLKRLDVTSRTIIALAEPGSCFAGFLAEPMFAADRDLMFVGQRDGDNRPEAKLLLTESNFGLLPMPNGISRLETRFLGEPETLEAARSIIGEELDGEAAEEAGLVTFAHDDIDWDDEVRIMIEERASFSPDSLTGLEANLRFAGPETMETKIFGRLSAWQNWIFQRPNAAGEAGALKKYGTGARPDYDQERV
jgi:benzoyl-CoA-dihydrodiol lyase